MVLSSGSPKQAKKAEVVVEKRAQMIRMKPNAEEHLLSGPIMNLSKNPLLVLLKILALV